MLTIVFGLTSLLLALYAGVKTYLVIQETDQAINDLTH